MEKKDLERMIRESVEKYLKKTFLIAGNWKMNMTIREGWDFLKELGDYEGKSQILLFPPYTTLAVLAEEFRERQILYGPQNFNAQARGAYTGEISIPMIQELGCQYALVGHSERRLYYKESDLEIREKIFKGLKSGLKLILCIGESLEDRETGRWKNVLQGQLEEDLRGIPKEMLFGLSIAYEPIWAIGTGSSASFEEIVETHAYLKEQLLSLTGIRLSLLYGGSVNEKNAAEIKNCGDVDGFLIGGASLKAAKFRKIIEICNGSSGIVIS